MLTAGQALPAVLGTSVPQENAADMKTVGWEVSLEWNDRLSNGFGYHIKGVLSDYQASITKFSNPTKLLGNSGVMFLMDFSKVTRMRKQQTNLICQVVVGVPVM